MLNLIRFAPSENAYFIVSFISFLVSSGRVVETINNRTVERAATPAELAKIKVRMEKAIEELRYLRDLEIQKKPALYTLLKSTIGLTDQEIRQSN